MARCDTLNLNFFTLGEFHAESKPLIHPEAVPADVKIITLQKHFEEHRGMDSVLLRIEHLYQPRDKMGSPQNIQLGKSQKLKSIFYN